MKPDGVKAIFDRLQAKEDEQSGSALWWIGPQSKPDNPGSLLEQHGLEPAGEVPGMAIDLVLVDSKPEMVTNFTIQKVSKTELQALWARIVAVGTGFPDVVTEAMARVEVTLTDPQYKDRHRTTDFPG